jgi:DNA-binding NarL/FixJ family response regulator
VAVAVISRYALVRAGLSFLVDSAPDRARVVDWSGRAGQVGSVDVVLYDLAGLAVDENVDDLRHVLATRVPVVGLARDGREDLAEGARTMGVRTIVSESASAAQLLGHLERAAGRFCSPPSTRVHTADRAAVLTARERDVLRMIGSGMSNREIADELVLSVNSVKTYVRSAYGKIGVNRRSLAVLWTVDHGLVRSPGQDTPPPP